MQRSIEQLEGVKWREPDSDAPRSAIRCFELRKKPISTLDKRDLRMLINQGVGLNYVVPLAVKMLEDDRLVETEHYRGDLLVAVLRVGSKFFAEHPDIRSRIEKMLATLPAELEKLDHIDFDTATEALEDGVKRFRA